MSLPPMASVQGEWPRPAPPSLFDVLDGPDPEAPPSLHDPRPDLESDSALWQTLLRAALMQDGELPDGVFARLHAVRCCSARLFRSAAGSYRIQPDADYLDGQKGWQADRTTILAPQQAAIAALLRELGP